MIGQVNKNYCADSRNNEFLADQIEPNAKKCVASVRNQSHTVFQTSNNNRDEKRGK